MSRTQATKARGRISSSLLQESQPLSPFSLALLYQYWCHQDCQSTEQPLFIPADFIKLFYSSLNLLFTTSYIFFRCFLDHSKVCRKLLPNRLGHPLLSVHLFSGYLGDNCFLKNKYARLCNFLQMSQDTKAFVCLTGFF